MNHVLLMSEDTAGSEISEGITVEGSGHREFASGMYHIKECIVSPGAPDRDPERLLDEWYEPGREIHSSQTAYLLADGESLLYDTLSPAGTDIVLRELERILGDEDLDYLVISHPEANHAGNAFAIVDAYPDVEVIVPGRGSHHELHGIGRLDNLTFVEQGDRLEVGRFSIEFVEEIFFDHAMTIWLYERSTNALFTSDFMGYEHMDGQCLCRADELGPDAPTTTQLQRFNGHAFPWFRFVDESDVDAAIDRIAETYDLNVIAPAHGQVITNDAASALETMRETIHEITAKEQEQSEVHLHQMMRYTAE